jgi:catechol 2,3-dioxygenase-like lactoylglutathione lyase family enzyme
MLRDFGYAILQERMRRIARSIGLAVCAAVAPTAALGQLLATGHVVNGHYHFNASDIDEHLRFWVGTLGGTAGTFGNDVPIVLFPNALLFMREQDPTGPMIGSTVNHVAFSVRDLRATVDGFVAAGYEMVTDTHAPPGVEVVDDIGILEGGGPVSGVAYVIGPDGIKVGVLEIRAQEQPIVSHHIHFFGEDREEMRAWYVDVFGATERRDTVDAFVGADLPGLGLNFSSEAGMAGTAGRVLDHIGFEVEGLETFTRGLEAKGITLDVPYRESQMGLGLAFMTDPWGTYIELTEGLAEIR